MLDFLAEWWDATVAVVFGIAFVVFAVIGVWTGSDPAGGTAAIAATVAVVFGIITCLRKS